MCGSKVFLPVLLQKLRGVAELIDPPTPHPVKEAAVPAIPVQIHHDASGYWEILGECALRALLLGVICFI